MEEDQVLSCPKGTRMPRHPEWDPARQRYCRFNGCRPERTSLSRLVSAPCMPRSAHKIFTVNFLGSKFIHTIEPENMKSLSTQVWKDLDVEPLRRLNKASMPFADKGVNTTDGHMREFSRFLIKSLFSRDAFSNTDRLGKHTDNLMALVPLDGSVFDIQPLFQRWVGQSSTWPDDSRLLMASSSCIHPPTFFTASP